jgi:hypothetical protein
MKPLKIINVLVLLVMFLWVHPGCKKSEFNWQDIIKINIVAQETDPIRADGISTVTFQAEIDSDSTEKVITFTTTTGSFVGVQNANTIGVPIDDSGLAQAILKVGKSEGTFEVVASVLTFRKKKDLTLDFAHAETLAWESSTLTVSKSGAVTATIKAFLSRGHGSVSEGAPVRFYATQINDQNQEVEVGRFINEIKTTNQVASKTFTADNPNVMLGKPIKIRIEATKDNGEPIETVFYLNVVE